MYFFSGCDRYLSETTVCYQACIISFRWMGLSAPGHRCHPCMRSRWLDFGGFVSAAHDGEVFRDIQGFWAYPRLMTCAADFFAFPGEWPKSLLSYSHFALIRDEQPIGAEMCPTCCIIDASEKMGTLVSTEVSENVARLCGGGVLRKVAAQSWRGGVRCCSGGLAKCQLKILPKQSLAALAI